MGVEDRPEKTRDRVMPRTQTSPGMTQEVAPDESQRGPKRRPGTKAAVIPERNRMA